MNIQISNRALALTLTESGLSLTNSQTDEIIFANARARIAAYNQEGSDLLEQTTFTAEATESGIIVRSSVDDLSVSIQYTLAPNSTELHCSLELNNHGTEAFQLGELSPLYFDRSRGAESHLLSDDVEVFSLGRMMVDSSQLGSREPGNIRAMAVHLKGEKKHFETEYILSARPVEASKLSKELILSFDHISKVSCGFVINLEDGVSYARAHYRGSVLPAVQSISMPTLIIDGINSADIALDNAAERVAEIYNPPLRPQVHSGWCSWYYYYPNVSESDILENLKFIAERRERLPYEYIQIDDGYQLHWGDWLLPGKKFPHDMAYLAKEISDLGFKPGIWVAPMIMTAQSNLFKNHPEWAVKNFETGEPLSQQGWSPPDENPWIMLDGTNPEFLEYIRHIFTVMAHEWGFDYFKLDALSHGAYPGLRMDPTQNGDQALRMVLEVIREAIGPDKYLLGCTVPFGSVIGLANGERVSGDVSTAFLTEQNGCSLERYLPQSIHRSFIHGKWWHNDPDCVLVRSKGTPHNETLADVGLSLEEARFFVSVVGLLQGIQMVGENMMELEEERLQLLETILPLIHAPVRPLDLYAAQPKYLHLDTDNGTLVCILNWTEEMSLESLSREFLKLDESAPYDVLEFWTQQSFGPFDSATFNISIPRHGCRVLLFRKQSEHPQFIGFNEHVSMGTSLLSSESWDAATKTLTLQFEANKNGLISTSAPKGWIASEASGLTLQDNGLWAAELPKGSNTVAYTFEDPHS